MQEIQHLFFYATIDVFKAQLLKNASDFSESVSCVAMSSIHIHDFHKKFESDAREIRGI